MPLTTDIKTAKIIIPETELETTFETLTQTESLEPEKKMIEKDTLHSRIILVSPYSLLNVFLESEIPRIVKGSELEIISHSDFYNPPYIDVNDREKHAIIPYWIIDFEKITTDLEKELIDENKLIRNRREGLADLIYAYEREIRKGIPFQNEFYIEEGRLSSKITSIVEKLTQSLDQKLPSIWKNAEEISKNKITVIDCVDFGEYYAFATKNRILHIAPSKEFSKEMLPRHEYDEAGNFIKNSQFIIEYFDRIKKDLIKLEEYGKRAKLELFSVVGAFS